MKLPGLPKVGATIELDDIHWSEDSFEVLAFLNPTGASDDALTQDDPSFVGRFFSYGSGRPRPTFADRVGLRVRISVKPEAVARLARGDGNELVLVPRDASGRALPHADLRVGAMRLDAS